MKKIIISTAIFLAVVSSLSAEDSIKNPQSKTSAPSASKSTKKGVPITAKFLTVELSDVYAKYNKAIEAQEKFDQAAESAQKEMNDMIQEGIKLGEAYKELQAKASNPALTEEAKRKFMDEANEKAKEIEEKQTQVVQYQQRAAQTLSERRQSLMNLHLTDMKKTFEKIAKEKGANLVLNTTGVAVMYSDGSADITEEAIQVLNAIQK